MKMLKFALLLIFLLPGLTFAAGNVTVSYPGAPAPLFDVSAMAPGYSITKTLSVTNNSTVNQDFKFTVNDTDAAHSLSDKITFQVVDATTSSEKYFGTLSSLFSAGEVNLGSIAPSATESYNFIATFDENAGNEYMGLVEQFDLAVGFAAAQTPTNIVERVSSVLGFTTSQTQVTVTDNAPEVAGVTTDDNTADDTSNQTVKGAEDSSLAKACPWWWILLLLLAVATAGISYVNYRKDKEPKYWYAWPLLFGVVAYFLHWNLHKGFADTIYCDWFWALDLVVIALITAGYKVLRNRKDDRKVSS